MSTWAVLRVKDEADVIEATLRHMLGQVDHVLVADNASSDGTDEIIKRLPVEYVYDPEIAYYQSAACSELARYARRFGAEWVISADADELWLARDGRRIADVLADLPDDVLVAEAALYDYVPTAEDPEGPPTEAIRWRRREPAPLPKVAVRARKGLTIHQGNHGASFEGVDVPLRLAGALQVAHFPLRSVEQMVRKARNGGAAYAATALDESVGAHWRQWNQLSDEQLGEVFREHYWSAQPEADPTLIFDPAP